MKLVVISWRMLFVCQAKILEPTGSLHSLHAGYETLWIVARPCHAVPMTALCMGKCSGKARSFLLLPLPPRHVYHNTEGILPRQWPPSHVSWAALPVLPLSPFQPGQCPHAGLLQDESGPGTTRSPGGPCPRARVGHAPEPRWAMPRTLARGGGRPAVSRGVCGLSLAARRSLGDSLCRAAPDGSWSQGCLQTMGGEQETPHGKQDLAPPPPPATAPWPLSFPCSREPFPQPSATGLHRRDGDAAARAGWGMRHSEPRTKSRVRTPPAWARGSAWLREP